jgi:hypothetical protein
LLPPLLFAAAFQSPPSKMQSPADSCFEMGGGPGIRHVTEKSTLPEAVGCADVVLEVPASPQALTRA